MSDQSAPKTDEEVERLIQEAVRKLGWSIPATIEDVKRLEEELGAENVELPESLRDPEQLLDSRRPSIPLSSGPRVSDTEENLAQAARFGRTIPDETMARMENDREAAQQQSDEQAEEE